jgi:hypothetical protein
MLHTGGVLVGCFAHRLKSSKVAVRPGLGYRVKVPEPIFL